MINQLEKDRPYPGLNYYDFEYRFIFEGRKKAIAECAKKLASTRILLLHGPTGCGKSSFLRAGLQPFFESQRSSMLLAKIPPQDEQGEQTGPIFVRSGDDPLGRLAAGLWKLVKQQRNVSPPLETMLDHSLDEILMGYEDEESFKNYASKASMMLAVFQKLAAVVQKKPIFVIDQAEEVFTLKPDIGQDESKKKKYEDQQTEYFRFLARFSKREEPIGSIRLCITMRTEYKGQFDDKLEEFGRDLSGIGAFYLSELNKDELIAAILSPTRKVPSNEEPSAPYEDFGFEFENGLAETIAQKLIERQSLSSFHITAGGILPALQVICSRLYKHTHKRERELGNKNWQITEKDFRELGGIHGQIEYFLEETLSDLVNWLRDKNWSDLDIRKQVDQWKLLLLELVKEEPDGRATTRELSHSDILENSKRYDCYNAEKGLENLNSEKTGIVKKNDEGKWVLGHDSVGLALIHWKREYDTLVVKRSIDFTDPIMKAYDFSYEDLYEKKEAERPEVIHIFDTGVWDHQLPLFAKQHGFDRRLGIDFEEYFPKLNTPQSTTQDGSSENRSVEIDEVIGELLTNYPLSRILASVPRVLFPLPIQKNYSQKEWQDPKQWIDITITNLYEGYALIGPLKISGAPSWWDSIKKRALTESWARLRLVTELVRLSFNNGTVWVYDKKCKAFFEFLMELVQEIPEIPHQKINVVPVISEGVSVGNRDPIVEKLLKNESDFGVGTAISRALAERAGFEIYIDAVDIPQMLKVHFDNDDKKRNKWEIKFNKLCVHNTWQINISQKEWKSKEHREIVLKLASIALYTVAYIRSYPEQYVRFISARLHRARLSGAFPLDTGSVRSAIAACYRFLPLEEYGETFFDRDGSFPYYRSEMPDLTEDLVAGDILYELLRLKGECIEHMKELAGKVDGDGLDRARVLKKRAWKHFQIFNYLDAERLFHEARNIVAGQNSAVTPDK